jgi:hypothetical protein
MNTGDCVKIFEDPVTEQKLEGNAQLVSKTNTPDVQLEGGSHLEFWLVVFPNGEKAYRKIKVKPEEADDREEEWGEAWRFTDSRGRSVFRNDR